MAIWSFSCALTFIITCITTVTVIIIIWSVAAIIHNCFHYDNECVRGETWWLHNCSWSLPPPPPHLSFFSSLLSSPFFSAHPNRSRQVSAHIDSGSRGFFQLMSAAHCGNCLVSLYKLNWIELNWIELNWTHWPQRTGLNIQPLTSIASVFQLPLEPLQ